MTNYTEQPFQFLKRKHGETDAEKAFSPEIIENWYKARAYVLDKLKDVKFGASSNDHLQVVVMDVDNEDARPLMLSIVRQVALSAHFLNYHEEVKEEEEAKEKEDKTKNENTKKEAPSKNRTVITIVTKNKDAVIEELGAEEYLCNLPKHGKGFIQRAKDNQTEEVEVEVDLKLEIISEWSGEEKPYVKIFAKNDVDEFCRSHHDIFSIDTRMAVYASRIYDLGTLISDMPYEDIHSAKRYSQALDAFMYIQLEKPWKSLINKDNQDDLTKVKEALSNLFCADCFKTRESELNLMRELDIKKCKDEQEIKKKRKDNYWENHIEALSKSEHARWVVEKLIMGYRPLNLGERIEDERIMGSKRLKEHRKQLKCNPENPAHIDLCSYADLRRIDPDNMRYDSFLMLAIPEILKNCSRK